MVCYYPFEDKAFSNGRSLESEIKVTYFRDSGDGSSAQIKI